MNTKSVLLVYATRYGSAKEVAEHISVTLHEAGLEVKLQPIEAVEILDACDAVVLGAAIYNAHLHPEAHRFLSRYQETLMRLPLAFFVLGPLSTSDAAMLRSHKQLEKELEKYPWLKPVALEIFVGKIDPSKMSVFERFVSPPATDHMDWDAIRTRVNELPALIQHEVMLNPTR